MKQGQDTCVLSLRDHSSAFAGPLHFDVARFDDTIRNAVFVVLEMVAIDGTVYATDGAASVSVVTEDVWTQDTLTWNTQPAIDAMSTDYLWRVTTPDRGEDQRKMSLGSSFNLANAVYQEALSDGELGLRIAIPDAWNAYHSSEATSPALRPRLVVYSTLGAGP